MLDPPPHELVRLHRLFCNLIVNGDRPERRSLVFSLLLSPLAQEKLRSACASLVRRSGIPHDLHDDLRQETFLHLADRLTAGQFRYQDCGPDAFGGWLWAQCLASCQSASHSLCPLWLCRIETRETRVLDELPQRGTVSHDAEQLAEWISLPPGDSLRRVLEDWLAGYTIRESARRQSLSKSEIDRWRRAIVRRFRRADSLDEE